MNNIYIDNIEIGNNSKVFIIAELSANHNQNFEIAKTTVEAAKEAGADAIKLQTYTADTITIDCDSEHFRINQGTIWDGKTLYKLYQEAYTPWEWQPKLKEIANSIGLVCFSSPFDNTAVDYLEKMNVPAYKVASFEITDIPLIQYIASKNKPIIISTGIATIKNIQEAIDACLEMGNDQIILMKCTSEYPAPLEKANLNTIPSLAERFDVLVGLSDHTLGHTAPVVSVGLGARVIEKHFVINKKIGGPDATFSLDKDEFKNMVKAVREAEKVLGIVKYEDSEDIVGGRVFSRSLYIVNDIKKGEVFTGDNIKSIRPGYGLAPKYLNKILGKRAAKELKKGTPFCEAFIKN